MGKRKRIEDLGLDPVLLERDKQKGLAMLREHRAREKETLNKGRASIPSRSPEPAPQKPKVKA